MLQFKSLLLLCFSFSFFFSIFLSVSSSLVFFSFSSSLAFFSQFLLLWCFSSVTLPSRRSRRRRSPPTTRSLSMRVRSGPASRCRYTRSLFLPAVQSRKLMEDAAVIQQKLSTAEKILHIINTPERYRYAYFVSFFRCVWFAEHQTEISKHLEGFQVSLRKF